VQQQFATALKAKGLLCLSDTCKLASCWLLGLHNLQTPFLHGNAGHPAVAVMVVQSWTLAHLQVQLAAFSLTYPGLVMC
jgi:hypothetical protein